MPSWGSRLEKCRESHSRPLADRLVPGELLPEVRLLLGVPQALREHAEEALRELGDRLVQRGEVDLVAALPLPGERHLLRGRGVEQSPVLADRRHHGRDEAPVGRLRRGDPLVQEQHRPGAPVADRQRAATGWRLRRRRTRPRPRPVRGRCGTRRPRGRRRGAARCRPRR